MYINKRCGSLDEQDMFIKQIKNVFMGEKRIGENRLL